MPYSLLSAATLGFDLVRLPAGGRVADVLLAALAADIDGIRRLASQSPAPDAETRRFRSRARELAAAAPRLSGPSIPDPGGEGDSHDRLVAHLERGALGSAAHLERLVRRELLTPAGSPSAVDQAVRADALDVLADAAVGHWAVEVLPPALGRRLTTPFEAAQVHITAPRFDGAVELGPAGGQLCGLLEQLRSLDQGGRARWRAAAAVAPSRHGAWAAAMHEACWAAHLSGRIGLVAAAQLYAVRAFLDGGLGPRDGARGVWNAVAGCVQGLAVADLLDSGSLAVLQGPLHPATGQRRAA